MLPLSLSRQFSFLLFLTFLGAGVDGSWNTSRAQNHGQVSGSLITASGPLSAGTIAFFRADQGSDPADRSILRIPERTAYVDEQGRFAVNIQFGSYILGYFSNQQKTHPGLPDNNFAPLLAGTSEFERYILEVAAPQIDTGEIPFYPPTNTVAGPSFIVQGTIRNESGRPLSGFNVVAKTEYNSFRPQYLSSKTDMSGTYTLSLPPGSYYLIARHRLNKFGRPVTGEYFGIWGVEGAAGEFGRFPINKDTDFFISGEAGQTRSDGDITVFKIPDPATQEEILRSKGKR